MGHEFEGFEYMAVFLRDRSGSDMSLGRCDIVSAFY